MEYEFNGISFNCENIKKALEDNFDYDNYADEDFVAVSKETYKHKEDGLNFDYKLAIYAICCDENKWWYSLELVPTFGSLTQSEQKSILDFCCLDDANDVTTNDIIYYGTCVQLVGEVIKGDFDEDVIAKIANIAKSVNSLRGFYLDKPFNQIGTNGWDMLKHCINGEPLFKFG